jgi:hypothetical protein
LKEALAESSLEPIMPDSQTSKKSIQPEDTLSQQISLCMEEPSKIAHIGNTLDPKLELVLIKFLQEKRDIFAWKTIDMPGVPRELIEHELHLDLQAKPIKQ